MKAGLTISELAAEIERQANAKKDYVVSTEHIRMEAEGGAPQLVLAERERVGVNAVAHRQIGAYADIPATYYDRMLADAPDLLATNVNKWLAKAPAKRLVRTLDGVDRAFLSDKYRPLENIDLAQAVLPVIGDMGVEIMSANVTEKRLYIKVVDKRIRRDMPAGRNWGDGSHIFFRTQSPALTISNSEVGFGALAVATGILDHVCTNLASFETPLKKYHVGKQLFDGDALLHLLTDETRQLTDRAVWAQVRDVVRGAFDEAQFNQRIDKILGLQECKIEGDPLKVVELAASRLGLAKAEQTSVLRHLIEGGDLTAYGVYNAVTRTAEDVEDYDRATQLEAMGGKLVELAPAEWRELAKAA